jgi:hypothetical protein
MVLLLVVTMLLMGSLRICHLYTVHRILHLHIPTFILSPVESLNGSSDIDLLAFRNLLLSEHFPASATHHFTII